jgi:hypothetical protein
MLVVRGHEVLAGDRRFDRPVTGCATRKKLTGFCRKRRPRQDRRHDPHTGCHELGLHATITADAIVGMPGTPCIGVEHIVIVEPAHRDGVWADGGEGQGSFAVVARRDDHRDVALYERGDERVTLTRQAAVVRGYT